MLVHNNDYLLFCFVFFLNFLFINTKWIPSVFFTSFHRHSLYSNFRKDTTIGAKNKAFRLKVKHGKKPKRKEKKKANRRHVRHHLSVENMLECENKVIFFFNKRKHHSIILVEPWDTYCQDEGISVRTLA